MRDLAMWCSIIGLVLYTVGMCRNFSNPKQPTKWGWFIIGIPVWLFGVGYFVFETLGWL